MLVLHKRHLINFCLSTSVGEIGRWFDMTFDGLKPLDIFVYPVEEMEKLITEMNIKNITVVDVPGCIINNRLKTMSIPLIDFDVKKQVDILIETSNLESDSRSKAVCAIVRGMGGGKTRAFEEMRRMLLLREGVFVLSTFILCIES